MLLLSNVRGLGRGETQFGDGVSDVAHPLEEVAAYGVEPVVTLELLCDSIEYVEPCGRTVDHGDGDGPVQGHHRVGRDPVQNRIDPEELRPVRVLVRRRLVVDRGDGGLKLILADADHAPWRR